jgi:FixJ family two-component response regulator
VVHNLPVFVSGSGDAATAVRAMKAGAVDFLTKPVADHEVLDAVFAALDFRQERRNKEASLAALRDHFTSLSTRERQVLLGVAGGKLNKQIAAELGVGEVMVKVHRANGMRKMHVRSVAELVRAIDQLSGIAEPVGAQVRDSKSVAGVANTRYQVGPGSRQAGHDPPSGRDPHTQSRTKR